MLFLQDDSGYVNPGGFLGAGIKNLTFNIQNNNSYYGAIQHRSMGQ